jgi:hypothetical protein
VSQHSKAQAVLLGPGKRKWFALLAALLAVGLATTFAVNYHRANATQNGLLTIYPDSVSPQTPAADDSRSVELGVRFSATQSGEVVGIRYFKSDSNTGTHVGTLWSSDGTKLATATFRRGYGQGWQGVTFSDPVRIQPGVSYVASYLAPMGHYAEQQGLFDDQSSYGISPVLRATAGVYNYGDGGFPTSTWRDSAYYVDVLFHPDEDPSTGPSDTASSTTTAPVSSSTSATAPSSRPRRPTSSAPVSSAPVSSTPPTTSTAPQPPPTSTSSTASAPAPGGAAGRFNTPLPAGVPAGLALTTYTGPSTITKDGTVIDAKDIPFGLEIAAKNVVITRSRIHSNDDEGIHVSGSLQISDSTVRDSSNGIGGDNYTATRVEVTNLADDGFKLGNNVHVDQSWCHDLTPSSQAHADCGQMQAGVTNMSVTNSWFDGGRNSALFIAPDLGPSSNGPVLIDNNVLGNGNYSLYCVDGNDGEYIVKNITITNNRFLNTAQYGPATVNVPVTASNNTWFSTGKSIGGLLG